MLRLRIQSLLAKVEVTYGTDPTPTGAANAILLKGKPTLTPMEAVNVKREVVRPFFGNAESLPSSIYGKLDFEVEMAGSGTAGIAPAWGPLLRACGLSETATAAPITGTAQAGGTTTTIKLAAGASAADDFYNGMPVAITAGTGNGQSGFIADYDGATRVATVVSSAWVAPDATSSYSIGANVVYRPVSQSIESATLYMNLDGVLHKFLGARGNVSGSLSNDAIPAFKFSMSGLFQPVVDAASPTVVLSGWKAPLPVNKANTPFFSLHNYAAGALESFDFDLANEIAHHALVGGTEQFLINDRKPSGNVSMEAVTVATKDWWTIVKNAALGPLAIAHGTAAGNRIAVTAPAAQILTPKYADKNGVAMFGAGLVPVPLTGNDELAITAF